MKKIISAILCLMISASAANAQETEIKITLSEQFFEALLEAVFTNLDQPKVPISLGAASFSRQESGFGIQSSGPSSQASGLRPQTSAFSSQAPGLGPQTSAFSSKASDLRPQTFDACDETVRLKREVDGVRTAVRFRNGNILAPIAFEGNYNPPLVGCIGFSGWAETTIELSLDKTTNALVGHARVLNVNLSGTNGIGSSLVTRIVQNSLDKKINPLKIIELERLSFTAPVQNSGKLRMEAIGIRHAVGDKVIDVYLKYRFKKGE